MTLLYIGMGLACASPPRPALIGASETLTVVEAGLRYRARIDTGAEASSLHATGIRLEGDRAHFVTANERGEQRAVSAPLVDLAEVRSAAGVEVRPRVRLRLSLRGVEKALPVSLRDRSGMEHRLLVGRDFLADDFWVDVTR